jgi:DNA-binding response OmpR family regulator
MTAPKRVLLVEDDADIAEIVALHLRDEGYSVEHATNGTTGLRLLEQQPWDALVLDLMLPGTDGLEVCRRARAMERYLPIIITSARGSEVQRVLGLEIGADDYLAKPFSVLELVARVRALLRRVDALARAATGTGAIRLGDLALFALEREVKLAGEPVELTPREFDLLYFFASNAGKVFSRSELLDRVWGHRHSGYEHTVNTHINRIRTKIEVDPANPRRILTVWGRGYKLALEGHEP